MYGDFARVYDSLMADVEYDAWAEFYHGLLSASGVPEMGTVLEAACGTGSMTVRLARRYRVLPGDLSGEMLTLAAEKARGQGLDLNFLCQEHEMPSGAPPGGCRHQRLRRGELPPGEKDLLRFLRTANDVLETRRRDRLADISSAHKLMKVLGDRPRIHREQDSLLLLGEQMERAQPRLLMRLSIFHKAK